MKRLFFTLLFLAAASASAQVTDTCRVFMRLVTYTGAPAPYTTLTIKKLVKGGVNVVIPPRDGNPQSDVNGIVQFRALRASTIWLYAPLPGLDSAQITGRPVVIPDQDTCWLVQNAATATVPARYVVSMLDLRAGAAGNLFGTDSLIFAGTGVSLARSHGSLTVNISGGGGSSAYGDSIRVADSLARLARLEILSKRDADSANLRDQQQSDSLAALVDSLAARDIDVKDWADGKFLTGYTEIDPTLSDSLAARALAFGDSLLSLRGWVRSTLSDSLRWIPHALATPGTLGYALKIGPAGIIGWYPDSSGGGSVLDTNTVLGANRDEQIAHGTTAFADTVRVRSITSLCDTCSTVDVRVGRGSLSENYGSFRVTVKPSFSGAFHNFSVGQSGTYYDLYGANAYRVTLRHNWGGLSLSSSVGHQKIGTFNGASFYSDLAFYTNASSIGLTTNERMRITYLGTVGIGLTAPKSAFQVVGAVRADSIVVESGDVIVAPQGAVAKLDSLYSGIVVQDTLHRIVSDTVTFYPVKLFPPIALKGTTTDHATDSYRRGYVEWEAWVNVQQTPLSEFWISADSTQNVHLDNIYYESMSDLAGDIAGTAMYHGAIGIRPSGQSGNGNTLDAAGVNTHSVTLVDTYCPSHDQVLVQVRKSSANAHYAHLKIRAYFKIAHGSSSTWYVTIRSW